MCLFVCRNKQGWQIIMSLWLWAAGRPANTFVCIEEAQFQGSHRHASCEFAQKIVTWPYALRYLILSVHELCSYYRSAWRWCHVSSMCCDLWVSLLRPCLSPVAGVLIARTSPYITDVFHLQQIGLLSTAFRPETRVFLGAPGVNQASWNQSCFLSLLASW